MGSPSTDAPVVTGGRAPDGEGGRLGGRNTACKLREEVEDLGHGEELLRRDWNFVSIVRSTGA